MHRVVVALCDARAAGRASCPDRCYCPISGVVTDDRGATGRGSDGPEPALNTRIANVEQLPHPETHQAGRNRGENEGALLV